MLILIIVIFIGNSSKTVRKLLLLTFNSIEDINILKGNIGAYIGKSETNNRQYKRYKNTAHLIINRCLISDKIIFINEL